jgi:hypothetical protein
LFSFWKCFLLSFCFVLFCFFCFCWFVVYFLFCFGFFFFRGRGYQLDWTLKFYGRNHKLAVTVQCLLHRWRNICLQNRNLFLSLLSYLRYLLVCVRYLWEHEGCRYKRTYLFYPSKLPVLLVVDPVSSLLRHLLIVSIYIVQIVLLILNMHDMFADERNATNNQSTNQ